MSDSDENTPASINQGLTLGRLRILGWQSWSDIFDRQHMNWIDIEMIRWHFEHAYYKEVWEMNVSLLGFNLCLEWWYGDHYPTRQASHER